MVSGVHALSVGNFYANACSQLSFFTHYHVIWSCGVGVNGCYIWGTAIECNWMIYYIMLLPHRRGLIRDIAEEEDVTICIHEEDMELIVDQRIVLWPRRTLIRLSLQP